MVRLASARWRARRGEPQAEQRRTPISRSAEQSRQKQRGPAVSREVTARRAPNWGRRARRREPAALRQRWSDAVPQCWQRPYGGVVAHTKSSTLSRKLGSEAALRSISGPTP